MPSPPWRSSRRTDPGWRGRAVTLDPLYDVCSSSPSAPSGNFTKTKVRFANEINSYRVGLTYFDVNFGTVLIDWGAADPVIRLQVREESGDAVLQQRVTLGQLRAGPKP